MQHMSAAYGIAVYHGDDRLRQTTYLHLYVEYAETWHSVLVNISATSFDVHVAT